MTEPYSLSIISDEYSDDPDVTFTILSIVFLSPGFTAQVSNHNKSLYYILNHLFFQEEAHTSFSTPRIQYSHILQYH